ncbi:DUF2799 domain-containing protein [Methylobrevis albus]|uniref:DUF2799 domain-containing protein n=1 Tax=Methylobrevis albus TaxID=2793297 RepID=A0A931MWZ5_9HYPH|nr:DUF2799 domain-containing protein [Methylobrevis albus]MBH0236272.1 DUF2799 domain-containing protein [Methylobrevis albus]
MTVSSRTITRAGSAGSPLRLAFVAGGLVAALAALSGCATLSQEQCRSGDWVSIGRIDGEKGEPFERIAEHDKACGRFGITVDRAAYSAGRDAGLGQFCRPARGFAMSLAGEAYRNVCPPALEGPFLAGYDIARYAGTARSAAKAAEAEANRARNDLREIERDLDRVGAEIATAEGEARAELDRRRRRLSDRRFEVRFDLMRAEREADRAADAARYAEAEARARFVAAFGIPPA